MHTGILLSQQVWVRVCFCLVFFFFLRLVQLHIVLSRAKLLLLQVPQFKSTFLDNYLLIYCRFCFALICWEPTPYSGSEENLKNNSQ